MVAVVISQPMYLPWSGMFEQMKACDIFIHYDDADYSRGGFHNRVQIKGPDGKSWLTAPVSAKIGTPMHDAKLDNQHQWQKKHLRTIEQFLAGQPYAQDAIALAYEVLEGEYDTLAALNMAAMEKIAKYIGLTPRFIKSSTMQATGSSSARVLALVQEVSGTRYLTGHGAADYLNHAIFDDAGIAVEYMKYSKVHYPQKYGEFDPYVTILDMIASLGKSTYDYLSPNTAQWQQFIEERANV